MNADILDPGFAEHFVQECRRERSKYPLSPVLCSAKTAKDIDMSGIFRMTPEQIDEALLLAVA